MVCVGAARPAERSMCLACTDGICHRRNLFRACLFSM